MTGSADWAAIPFPDLAPSQTEAILQRHGLTGRPVSAMASTGVINAVFALGDDFVLRVPKAIGEGLADTRTESVAVPAAVAAGVRTPKLVAFDDRCDIVDVPYAIYERVHGVTLGLGAAYSWDWLEPIARDVGRQLAVLHAGVAAVDDPLGYLDDAGRSHHGSLVDELLAGGLLVPDLAQWLAWALDRLWPAAEAGLRHHRFIHNDTKPTNWMVTADGEAVLIDWGDAAWSDPAIDFAYLPARWVPSALAGYREIGPVDDDGTAEARILYDKLVMAAWSLRHGPAQGRLDWFDPPGGPLLDLLALALSKDGGSWAEVLDGP